MDIKPLFGLCGVLIAAMTSEFNDQVTSIALSDARGALGISHDAGSKHIRPWLGCGKSIPRCVFPL